MFKCSTQTQIKTSSSSGNWTTKLQGVLPFAIAIIGALGFASLLSPEITRWGIIGGAGAIGVAAFVVGLKGNKFEATVSLLAALAYATFTVLNMTSVMPTKCMYYSIGVTIAINEIALLINCLKKSTKDDGAHADDPVVQEAPIETEVEDDRVPGPDFCEFIAQFLPSPEDDDYKPDANAPDVSVRDIMAPLPSFQRVADSVPPEIVHENNAIKDTTTAQTKESTLVTTPSLMAAASDDEDEARCRGSDNTPPSPGLGGLARHIANGQNSKTDSVDSCTSVDLFKPDGFLSAAHKLYL